ncbi:hypothetical protein [Agrobacterium bohemicum]|uniref:RNA helicase n=1 Tax=Agrobacterium bohemicum TaxID=2052828 RepID=A0A135P311_9HYPH|nr:hypothetical protein [Agrobacterium bohemicum]KXG85796.1 hypothetical protein ATO67_03940 [Agrobacterium bohemicum]
MSTKSARSKTEDADQPAKLPFCGIIMPIAAMGQYEKSHWDRVRIILDEAIANAGYTPRLVSESEDIGVIHARIVQNLYDDAIVVCDVSGKNANVMFELGLRLAFDKPTIVIKDDQTAYSFDTSPIEHISYRADLRFDDVRDFGKKVAAAIKASVAKKREDASYSPFLGHFGKFKVTGLETKEVSSERYIIEQLQSLQGEISRLSSRLPNSNPPPQNRKDMLVTAAMAKNLASSLVQFENFDLSSDIDVSRFIDRVHEEVKDRGINISQDVLNKIIVAVVQETKPKPMESASLF